MFMKLSSSYDFYIFFCYIICRGLNFVLFLSLYFLSLLIVSITKCYITFQFSKFYYFFVGFFASVGSITSKGVSNFYSTSISSWAMFSSQKIEEKCEEKKIKRKSIRKKNRFKLNKLFLYASSNSFYYFPLLYKN